MKRGILQTKISGISLFLDLRTKMQDPHVYIVFGGRKPGQALWHCSPDMSAAAEVKGKMPDSTHAACDALQTELQAPTQGVLFWLFTGSFKVSLSTVSWHRSSHGTDFDSSETASPARCSRCPSPELSELL